MSLLQGTWKLSTAPTVEPVTGSDLAAHLKLDSDATTADAARLTVFATAARRAAETFTRRAFITQSWTLNLDDWPSDNVILLPNPPAQSVTSVKYYDTAGVQQTLVKDTDYQVDTASEPARVTVEPDVSWPSIESGRLNAVEVIYVAGFGAAAAAVPEELRLSIMMSGAAWYLHPEAITDFQKYTLPWAAEMLLWQYRALEA